MSADGWPDGVGRIILDAVDSTNAEAARRAPALDRPTWIMARAQTAARGRRGRPWATTTGNLAATLVMRPGFGPQAAGLRSFVAALALFDALVAVTGRAGAFALKWPNDVLLHGGKLAGILLEGAGSGGQVSHLAIGIGVNLATAPGADAVEAGALRPVSLAGETGLRIAPEEFLPHLAAAFAQWEGQLQAMGFAPLRDAFMARAANVGAVIEARTGSQVITGRFDSLDETGALILITDQGRRAIAAAEVFFRQEAGHAAGD
ncbi:MAG: biotin--[acetyl-CoA-carboxylase] ligase [Rhodobacteraceae bacterium]|nr:biotin--[acetyl-CoA-carboxylase] ligase [Paracoccaceae bacterium]